MIKVYLILAPFSLLGENFINSIKDDEEYIFIGRNLNLKKENYSSFFTNSKGFFDLNVLESPSKDSLDLLSSVTHVFNFIHPSNSNDILIDKKVISYFKELNLSPQYFIFGSRKEFSLENSSIISEETPRLLDSDYAKLKDMQEKVYSNFNVNFFSIKISNLYVFSKNFFEKKTFINLLLKSVFEKNSCNFNLSNNIFVDFIYIKYAINAIKSIIESNKRGCGIFVLGSGEKTKVEDIINSLKLFFPNVEVNFSDTLIENNFSFVFDNSRIKKFIYWNPEFKFIDGFKETISLLKK